MSANAQMVLEAAEHAVAHASQHNQSLWVTAPPGADDYRELDPFDVAASNGDAPPCGTRLCLAGWIAFLNAPAGSKIGYHGEMILPGDVLTSVADFATDIADLTRDQRAALFLNSGNDDVLPMARYLVEHPDALAGDLIRAADDARFGSMDA